MPTSYFLRLSSPKVRCKKLVMKIRIWIVSSCSRGSLCCLSKQVIEFQQSLAPRDVCQSEVQAPREQFAMLQRQTTASKPKPAVGATLAPSAAYAALLVVDGTPQPMSTGAASQHAPAGHAAAVLSEGPDGANRLIRSRFEYKGSVQPHNPPDRGLLKKLVAANVWPVFAEFVLLVGGVVVAASLERAGFSCTPIPGSPEKNGPMVAGAVGSRRLPCWSRQATNPLAAYPVFGQRIL